jgi:hypothetical protein
LNLLKEEILKTPQVRLLQKLTQKMLLMVMLKEHVNHPHRRRYWCDALRY